MFTITQQINVRPPERHTCRSLQRLSQEQFILFSILMPLGQATPTKARSCAKVHVLPARLHDSVSLYRKCSSDACRKKVGLASRCAGTAYKG